MTSDGSLFSTSSYSGVNQSINNVGRSSLNSNLSGGSASGRTNTTNSSYDSMSSSSLQSRYGNLPSSGSNNNYNSSMMSSSASSIMGYNNQNQGRQGLNMSVMSSGPASHRLRETIHSGHFMVSDFEPESEALDDEYEVGMPVPPEEESINMGGHGSQNQNQMGQGGGRSLGQTVSVIQPPSSTKYTSQQISSSDGQRSSGNSQGQMSNLGHPASFNGPISIDGLLTKLFQFMSLAYR